jgi:hypothetical protein
MKLTIVSLCFVAVAFGQYQAGSAPRAYSTSPSGFGSILYPGGLPQTGNVTDTSFGSRLGATVRGVPMQPGPGHYGGRPPHQQGRPILVPFPVIAGPAYYPPYGYSEPQPVYVQAPTAQQQQPPVVIINQNYKPDTVNPQLRDYSNADLPEPTLKVYENKPKRVIEDDKPTIYLIAMKEGSIMPALAYWVEGDTLNYITRESSHNRISLDRVDREFSAKLNQERGLEFRIPPQ